MLLVDGRGCKNQQGLRLTALAQLPGVPSLALRAFMAGDAKPLPTPGRRRLTCTHKSPRRESGDTGRERIPFAMQKVAVAENQAPAINSGLA